MTVVEKDEEEYALEEIPRKQRDAIAKLANVTMVGSSGLPLSVSVMTPSFHDETCLRVMKEVERVAKFEATPKAYRQTTPYGTFHV